MPVFKIGDYICDHLGNGIIIEFCMYRDVPDKVGEIGVYYLTGDYKGEVYYIERDEWEHIGVISEAE